MMVLRLFVLALLLGCERRDKPDVYLISVDTLRWDHVGANNPNSPAKTPAIDALANDSIRFTDAFTPISVTGPAFASVMTGLSVSRHGVMMNLFRNGTALNESHLTLAEAMSSSGYKTAAFISAFTLRPKLGLNQGFDIYDSPGDRNRTGDVTADRFVDWLNVQEGELFAWFHSFDPHGPVDRHLHAGELHDGLEREVGLMAHIPQYQRIEDVTDPKLYETLYARGVEFADTQVGKVIEGIKAAGRYEKAMIIFFADHGEGFRERELWYDHGSFAHVEQMRVPLFIKLPSEKNAGRVDDRLTSLMDIAPSVTDLVDINTLKNIDGRSLLSKGTLREVLVAESSHCKRVPVLRCSPEGGQGKQVVVRTKHMTMTSSSTKTGEEVTRYDRIADPKEWTPLEALEAAPAYPTLLKERTDRRTREYARLPAMRGRKSDVETQQLKALGYLE